MSLEQAITDNTAAIRDLIAAIGNKPLPQSVATALGTISQPATAAEATARLHNQHGKKEEKKQEPTSAPTTPAASPSSEAVDFDTLKKQFLALAGKNRDKAVAILGEFGAAKLTETKPEDYAAIAAKIAEASV